MDTDTERTLRGRLITLEVEHRDLDEAIHRLSEQPTVDQLHLQRLKKRKLLIKDQITLIRSRLIPDMDA